MHMMGRLDKQLRMVYIDMSSMVPEHHLLRVIKENIDFEFIYDRISDCYSSIGRPSIDPVLLIKMLLVGYLYGIKSERRLEEEVSLNIAYRWFCDLDLDQRVPDHSTFSQNRRRRFQDGRVFEDLWTGILQQILQLGLIKVEISATEGSSSYLSIMV
jgi:transposase